jgi:hypothetical protein
MKWMPALLIVCLLPLGAQEAADDPVTLSTEHPRLLLRPARLRLLRRERDRTSMRWQQFDALVQGNAPLPEPGFALALHFQVSGEAVHGKRAIEWAMANAGDVRQTALVFDWCQDLMTEAQRRQLSNRLAAVIAQPPADKGVATARDRAFAAIVLFDHIPDAPQRELERLVRSWWRDDTVKSLKSGRAAVQRGDAYPLYELLHAFRDNTNIDLREPVGQFFKEYPIEHLMSYYPAPFPGPETEYHINAESRPGTPDLKQAALSRAAELAMVAYDTNGAESQVLQGWLMHDRFILKGTYGASYEFLWANPYQPGLSYYHVPLVYYNPDFGTLFVRSTWDDTARWFGYFEGTMQLFEDGKAAAPTPRQMTAPLSLTEAVIGFAQTSKQFRLKLDEEQGVFILGLRPKATYQIEIDDEEIFEAETDAAGILALLDVPRQREVGVRIRETISE